jgi:mannose-6-phosphate isomerase-like protein (cupin superfamily)
VKKIFKSFDSLTLNFNELFNLFSNDNYASITSGKYLNQYILDGTYVIKDVHKDIFFKNLIEKCIETFNIKDKKIDVHLFIGFKQGSTSIIHRDNYDVILYNLYGETMYIIEKENFLLEKNDLIMINKNEVHQAISMSPRITFSLGVH